jgi:Transcription elongation factor
MGTAIIFIKSSFKIYEKLFIQEVPEIYDGIIEIKSFVEDPGSRAKILCLSC